MEGGRIIHIVRSNDKVYIDGKLSNVDPIANINIPLASHSKWSDNLWAIREKDYHDYLYELEDNYEEDNYEEDIFKDWISY